MPEPDLERMKTALLQSVQFKSVVERQCVGDNVTALARAALDALGLSTQWAVSSGDRREFELFDELEQARRALCCRVTKNEHWKRNGREIPLWARNPRMESRQVSNWEPVTDA